MLVMKDTLERFNRILAHLKQMNPLVMESLECHVNGNRRDLNVLTLDYAIYLFRRAAIDKYVDTMLKTAVKIPFKSDTTKEQRKNAIAQFRKKVKEFGDLASTDEAVRHLESLNVIKAGEFSNLISSGLMSLHLAFSLWQIGKVIFDFDKSLFNIVSETDIKKLPVELFERLPYHCFYVSLPLEIDWQEPPVKVHGFWVFKDQYLKNKELSILVDVTDKDGDDGVYPFRLHMCSSSLEDAIQNSTMIFESDELRDKAVVFISKIVNVILYLCSDDADIILQPNSFGGGRKKNAKTGMSSVVRVFACGYRVSSALKYHGSNSHTEGKDSQRMASHIRRAHWHTYLVGPKVDKIRILKWLSPILVNIDESEYIATVKRVKT